MTWSLVLVCPVCGGAARCVAEKANCPCGATEVTMRGMVEQ
jgi:hypothetical protein